MKTRWFRLIFLLILLVGVRFLLIAKEKQSENQRWLLISSISTEISRNRSSEINVVDLSTIVSIPWERLFIFGPYTSADQIKSKLGFDWIGIEETLISSHEGYVLLVFVNGKNVSQYLEFPRDLGDFVDAENDIGYSREHASFIFDEHLNAIWVSQ